MARTSVSDPTPRSTPPAPPPDPERVRGGHGCGSSLTEAWRPLERGAEALEGVGVPELMEGAGPTPGTKTPRLPGGWMRQTGRKSKYRVSSVPQIHSSWDLSVGVGGVEGRTEPSWALGVRAGDAAGGPTGASPPPRTRGCSYTPKTLPEASRVPFTLHSPAGCWPRPPHAPRRSDGAGDGLASVGREGIPAQRRQSGREPHAPPAGRAPLRTVPASRRSGRPQATRCSLGREKVGGDTQRRESQEGGTSRGRGGKSGRVRRLRAARWGPATPRSPARPPASGRRGSGQRPLGIAWSRVPRGRAAAAGGARRPGGVGAGVL